MWTENVPMKTATVRDLRNNFAMLEAWLSDGEEVCIEKRGEPIAMLTTTTHTARPAAHWRQELSEQWRERKQRGAHSLKVLSLVAQS